MFTFSCVAFTQHSVVGVHVITFNNSLFLVIDFPVSRVDLKL